jgi:hypothetical protein
METPQIVATALALTLRVVPAKVQLLKRLPPEERRAHRHVAGDFAPPAFTQIVGRQGSIGWPSIEFFYERQDALRIEDDIVVQKHQPGRTST